MADKFEPKEVVSFECMVCGQTHKKTEEARQCAMDDTRSIKVESVLKDDKIGYPTVFLANFRTGAVRKYALIETCEACGGKGEKETADGELTGTYPCEACRGTGYQLVK